MEVLPGNIAVHPLGTCVDDPLYLHQTGCLDNVEGSDHVHLDTLRGIFAGDRPDERGRVDDVRDLIALDDRNDTGQVLHVGQLDIHLVFYASDQVAVDVARHHHGPVSLLDEPPGGHRSYYPHPPGNQYFHLSASS